MAEPVYELEEEAGLEEEEEGRPYGDDGAWWMHLHLVVPRVCLHGCHYPAVGTCCAEGDGVEIEVVEEEAAVEETLGGPADTRAGDGTTAAAASAGRSRTLARAPHVPDERWAGVPRRLKLTYTFIFCSFAVLRCQLPAPGPLAWSPS
jgi:hypothetical protein